MPLTITDLHDDIALDADTKTLEEIEESCLQSHHCF